MSEQSIEVQAGEELDLLRKENKRLTGLVAKTARERDAYQSELEKLQSTMAEVDEMAAAIEKKITDGSPPSEDSAVHRDIFAQRELDIVRIAELEAELEKARGPQSIPPQMTQALEALETTRQELARAQAIAVELEGNVLGLKALSEQGQEAKRQLELKDAQITKLRAELEAATKRLHPATDEVRVLRGCAENQGEAYVRITQERNKANAELAQLQVENRSLRDQLAKKTNGQSHENAPSGSLLLENEAKPALSDKAPLKVGDKRSRLVGKKTEVLLVERLDKNQVLCSVEGRPNSAKWLHHDIVSALPLITA